MNTIPIVIATDNDYVEPTAAAISSLLMNAKKDTIYEINILSSLSLDNCTQIEKFTALNKHVSFNFIDMQAYIKQMDLSKYMDDKSDENYLSIATYFRFFLPEIFTEYDKILYMDVDMITVGDLSELFNVDLKDNYAAVVKDAGIEFDYKKNNKCSQRDSLLQEYMDEILKVAPEEYFNAGLMLFNLKQMREDNVKEKLFNFLNTYFPFEHHEQDILNAVLKNRLLYLDNKWNYYASCPYKPNSIIIHFVGSLKPWLIKRDCYFEKWWFYFKQTPFWNSDKELQFEKLKKIHYLIMRVGAFTILEYRKMGFEPRMELKLFNRLKLRWNG